MLKIENQVGNLLTQAMRVVPNNELSRDRIVSKVIKYVEKRSSLKADCGRGVLVAHNRECVSTVRSEMKRAERSFARLGHR